jgi:hypothetical protein
VNRSPAGEETLVLIGYMHASKADRSRVVGLKRDALAKEEIEYSLAEYELAEQKNGKNSRSCLIHS